MKTKFSMAFLGAALDAYDDSLGDITAYDYMGAFCAGREI